jgi:hypothetical protein
MRIACITPDNKRDYLVETILEGLVDLHVDLVVSDPGNGVTNYRMSDDAFVQEANACDAVLAFFGKVRGNSPPRHHLLDLVKLPRERKAYIDGSEWSYTGWEHKSQAEASRSISPLFRKGEPWLNESMLEKCGHYFKRECYPIDVECGITPLPFALCKRHVLDDGAPRDIDVFCSFGHTKTGLRQEAIEVIEHFQKTLDPSLGIRVVTKSGMSQKEYINTLWRSRIVIDAWGGGDTTDRFWEGVGAKACILYQRHQVVTPNPFVDFEHAVSWETPSELSNSLHRLVYSADEAETIGSQGFEHALRFHTARHRAEEILRALER